MKTCMSKKSVDTTYIMYCTREEGHEGACHFYDRGEHIWLSHYEIANLKSMMTTIFEAPTSNPLKIFNSGDWFNELKWKLDKYVLPQNSAPPCKTPDQYLIDFERRNA